MSAILGICQESTYEGQGAVELENAAALADMDEMQHPLPYAITEQTTGWVADLAPCIRQLSESKAYGEDSSVLALRFHATVCQMIVDMCEKLRQQYGLNRVALSGGVFLNRILMTNVLPMLACHGLRQPSTVWYPRVTAAYRWDRLIWAVASA